MVATPAIRALIRDDKVHQIQSAMQAGKKYGMQTMNDALYQLYMNREVAQDECLRVSPDPNEFLRMIGEKPLEEQEIGTAPSGKSGQQQRRAPLTREKDRCRSSSTPPRNAATGQIQKGQLDVPVQGRGHRRISGRTG